MGINVEIYFESLDEQRPTDYISSENWKVVEADEYEKESGATHCVSTCARYYGEHYERGPWQDICGVLLGLFASTNVGKIWYFGDCRGGPKENHPIEIEDVLRISKHYMLNGERPYRSGAERVVNHTYANIIPKDKPKWFELKKWTARLLVRLAQRIDPTSPDVIAFHMQQMMDLMITGSAITRIDPFKHFIDVGADSNDQEGK